MHILNDIRNLSRVINLVEKCYNDGNNNKMSESP